MTRVEGELAALADRHGLPEGAVTQLGTLLAALAADPHAPTTVRAPAEAVHTHLADALVALELVAVREATTVADLGAGAGFPGLPLAIALPAASVALVESNARKCAFIESAVAAARIGNAHAVASRAESWGEGRGACDLVTARALAPLAVIAEYAAPLLRDGGVLVAWKGRRDPAEEHAAAAAAELLGLSVEEVRAVAPYAGAAHRHLHVLRKVAPTPPRFPRRPGMARKRPLGAAIAAPSDRPRS
ncbi:MAG: 16S rRNA (guanine(527)-N(7))-methyltransferase RsmG [Conexibacter sp.]